MLAVASLALASRLVAGHTPRIGAVQELKKKIGNRVRELRVKQGWSQEEFADRCEIHRGHMGQIERGEKNVSIATLVKIGKGLGMTVSAILDGVI
jgi:XRE family transcriptional regulator, regulator of sulfur utilization